MPQDLAWVKNSKNQQWFDLLRLNVESNYFNGKLGVYVIWYTSPTANKVIKVGSGDLSIKLREERNNPQVTTFSVVGPIKVAWAVIDPHDKAHVPGIESYLIDYYTPILNASSPIDPVPVNPIS